MSGTITLEAKTMQDIKYQQGVSDGIFTIHTILIDMANAVENLHKQKRYTEVPNVIASGIQGVALIWDEANQQANRYIEKLKESNQLDYDPNTEYLEIDEETNVIHIKPLSQEE